MVNELGRLVTGMGDAWSCAKSKSGYDSPKATLSSKEEVKPKLSEDNKGKVENGLINGSVKLLKISAGATFMGLAIITPKRQSDEFAKTGLNLLNPDRAVENYGSYKRDKIKLQAQKMLGQATKSIGESMSDKGLEIMGKNRAAQNGIKYRTAAALHEKGISMQVSGPRRERRAEDGLVHLKKPDIPKTDKSKIKFDNITDLEKRNQVVRVVQKVARWEKMSEAEQKSNPEKGLTAEEREFFNSIDRKSIPEFWFGAQK